MNAYQRFNQFAEQVTNEVIEQLEQGKVLWQKPWTSYGLPENYQTGRHYEGFNAFYLNYITEKKNFTAPYFLTFKQAQELGGYVRKGEKGTTVIYWKIYEKKAGETPPVQAEGEQQAPERKFIPFLWTVFNIDQIEGVDFDLPAAQERTGQQVIAACQHVVDHYPLPSPQITYGGPHAYYAPGNDIVRLPDPKSFVSSQAYYATLFHELIHSTGHPDRLNRFTDEETASRFGDENYSKEELIAEMGASFLSAFTGIKEDVFQNSVAYLQGWASRFRDDKTMIIYTSTKAFRAASYLLDLNGKASKEALPAMAMAA
ncbi:antirestriction protein ArdC [Pontibacter ummariensis]|uniref:Antirestriction protein ArdC n=1 Tax=Pontibacter ummariensis TaxID=1610492 RepID=A0A239IUT0_9BACT|nr:ArdC-like ssDNA-binding domain-containing protein [Pontibacter ummariensis]PRY08968.1 antirestriction protein ArdC [Pontibacter ummariensis]SNS97285.1 Antirestriction protein ArdC [Pontibacter ummariensis]